MSRFISFFLPKEAAFFRLLNEQADTVLESSKIFSEYLKKYSSLSKKQLNETIAEIDALEKKGDSQSKEIIDLLNTSLITPYDREDIHALTVSLDDQLDFIQETAKELVLYRIKKIPKLMQEQAVLLHKMVFTIQLAIKHLNKLPEVKKYCNEIYHLEHQGDRLFREAISELFNNHKKNTSVLDIIKFKELYEDLETRFDKGKDLADILQSIVVKHG